ncbi:MAG TPA: TauD/TfdA family dioxygenase [Rhizomicrobium sp.]|jgi:taurine dioxygenase|nr:TauD/TfdA family dioxygenase [Rhizomicrobium sp.]
MIVHPAGKFDNHARTYKHIEARPLAAAMGAEICGVQLSNLSDAQFAEIRDALFRHKMIYFRDQNISHADQEGFGLRFGPFAEDAYTKGVEGHPNVQPVIKEAGVKTGMVFGSGWHTDSPFLPRPPAISMLYGVEIPPFGGDTIWANTVLAYAMLSETMQRMLSPLRVHMSMTRVLQSAQSYARVDDSSLGRLAALRGAATLPEEVMRKVEGTTHPLVRTHPVTGEKSLYCDGTYAVSVEGLSEPESQALLNFLVAHITQPAFTCRLRWEPRTFALWDNRICIHQAFNDYDGYRRELYRTTVAGETPA